MKYTFTGSGHCCSDLFYSSLNDLAKGAFTGIAAFLGAFFNMNFMLAGVASTNPLLFTVSIFPILAWRVASWYGLDRWLLPKLGTPWWRPGEDTAVK